MRFREILKEVTVSWDGISISSMSDKLKFFEQYCLKKSYLKESIDTSDVEMFESLSHYATSPVVNNWYIGALLMLLENNNVIPFNDAQILKYTGTSTGADGIIIIHFLKEDGTKGTWPDSTLSEKSYYKSFLFDSTAQYDIFRSAVALKYSKSLPKIEMDKLGKQDAI
jgi:hypothetical protein